MEPGTTARRPTPPVPEAGVTRGGNHPDLRCNRRPGYFREEVENPMKKNKFLKFFRNYRRFLAILAVLALLLLASLPLWA